MSELWTKWEGQVIDGFPLRRCLGVSDHSGVFLTEDPAHQLPTAAVKLVPLIPTLAESQLAHWSAAASLSHPRLIRLSSMGRCQLGSLHCLYVVMEYAEQNLAHFLAQRALTDTEVREMLPALFETLGFLHSRNLVHGQLKPSNILVVGDQLKLASDTIRPAGEAATSISMVSVYDPPEARDGSFSAAGDIWALGVTLFEALTRTTPTKPDERSHGVLLPPDFPPGCADMVRECLSRRPVDRPSVVNLQAWVNGALRRPIASASAVGAPASESRPNIGDSVITPALRPTSAPDADAAPPTDDNAAPAMVDRARPAGAIPGAGAAGVTRAGPAGLMAGALPARAADSGSSGVVSAATSAREAPGPAASASAAAALQQSATAGPSLAAAGAPPGADGRGRLTIRAVVEREPMPAEEPRRSWLPFAGGAIAVLAIVWLGSRFLGSHSNPTAPPPTASTPPAPAAQQQQPDTAATDESALPPARDTTGANSNGGLVRHNTTAPAPNTHGAPPTAAATAAVLHEEIPKVPHSALATIRGHVRVAVRVTVDASGAVISDTLADPGPSRYFARVASQAARKWKFSPEAGKASRHWLVRFEFSRSGTTAHATQKS